MPYKSGSSNPASTASFIFRSWYCSVVLLKLVTSNLAWFIVCALLICGFVVTTCLLTFVQIGIRLSACFLPSSVPYFLHVWYCCHLMLHKWCYTVLHKLCYTVLYKWYYTVLHKLLHCVTQFMLHCVTHVILHCVT